MSEGGPVGDGSGLVFWTTPTPSAHRGFPRYPRWPVRPCLHLYFSESQCISLNLKTLALILEHFLKFLLKCFLRASEKQRKQKTSAKFMHAWKCGPTQQKFSGLCSPGRVFLN